MGTYSSSAICIVQQKKIKRSTGIEQVKQYYLSITIHTHSLLFSFISLAKTREAKSILIFQPSSKFYLLHPLLHQISHTSFFFSLLPLPLTHDPHRLIYIHSYFVHDTNPYMHNHPSPHHNNKHCSSTGHTIHNQPKQTKQTNERNCIFGLALCKVTRTHLNPLGHRIPHII